MTYRQKLGKWGETLAADTLIEQGYRILYRNYRTSYGEIDLVASRGEWLVFVEVKTRRSQSFGYPETSVTPRKQNRLIMTAQAFLSDHPEWGGNWRIDVIAIQKSRSGSLPEIIHYENAVMGG